MSNSVALSDVSVEEAFRIELSYSGPSVADGSIPVDDLLASLQGFATAFRKLARTQGLSADRLRLRAARPGSFLVVLALLGPADISAGAAAFSAAVAVVGLIVNTVKGARHGKREEQIDTVQSALVKLMAPVRGGEIEAIEIRAEYTDRVVRQTLTIEDKAALQQNRRLRRQRSDSINAQLPDVANERQLNAALSSGSSRIRFSGTIEALKKSTNEGELVLQDGTTVACRLVGPEPERLYQFFASVRPLRIIGSPQFTDGRLSSIDVVDIEPD